MDLEYEKRPHSHSRKCINLSSTGKMQVSPLHFVFVCYGCLLCVSVVVGVVAVSLFVIVLRFAASSRCLLFS